MRFFGATQVIAQSFEEVDTVLDTSRVTGWDIGIALTILAVSWPVSAVTARIVKRLFRRFPSTPDYVPSLAARGARILVLITALALSMSLVGVNVGWFTVTLALVAIVAVLMLKPLAENAAAGFLLDSRPAFHVGDEIVTNGYEGEVIAINARVTVIRTRDWRWIHIPNTDVLSDTIVVYTASARRRSTIDLDIEYAADIAEATRLLIEAASSVEGVHDQPQPIVRAQGFGTATYTLSLRWWHDPDVSSGVRTLDGVVREVKRVLDDAGIGLPSPELIVRQPDMGRLE